MRREAGRHLVRDEPVYDSTNRVFGARLALSLAEEYTTAGHRRTFNALAVDRKRDQATRRRQAQDAWPLIPFEAPGNAPRSGLKPDARVVVLCDNLDWAIVDRYLVGPVSRITRQDDPLLCRMHRPLLRELGTRCIDRQLHATGPCTDKVARLRRISIEIERAVPVFLVFEYPLLPTLQIFRDVDFGRRYSGNGYRKRKKQQQGDQPGV